MYFYNGGTLHLSSYEYNACMIMTELAKIVENHGGRVENAVTKGSIVNRSLNEKIKELSDRAARYEELAKSHKNGEAFEGGLRKLNEEIYLLKQIKNDPVPVTHSTYIRFLLDDCVVYYQIDENPFFEFYYTKTKLRGDQYSKDACLTEAPKDWLYDCFFCYDRSKADIVEAANLIFNWLESAPETEIRRDSERVRVPNVYNSGTHIEMVLKPERMEKLKF